MNIALDTNIVVYAAGLDGQTSQIEMVGLIRRLPTDSIVLPVQVLSELFRVLVRKSRIPLLEASEIVLNWQRNYSIFGTTPDVLKTAIDLSVRHELSIWDSIVLATSASAGCRILLSEDLHHGFTWAGVTIVNPFQRPHHPLLTGALRP